MRQHCPSDENLRYSLLCVCCSTTTRAQLFDYTVHTHAGQSAKLLKGLLTQTEGGRQTADVHRNFSKLYCFVMLGFLIFREKVCSYNLSRIGRHLTMNARSTVLKLGILAQRGLPEKIYEIILFMYLRRSLWLFRNPP